MSDKSGIEWTKGDDGTPGATWNPIRGLEPNRHMCRKVSPGCDNCYASLLNRRFGGIHYPRVGPGPVDVRLDDKTLRLPLRWKRPRRVFVCSMTDLFGEWVPESWIAAVFAVMETAHQHEFQVLTKRPERAAKLLTAHFYAGWMRKFGYDMLGSEYHANNPGWPLPNVWIGTSIELDRYSWRAQYLRQTTAAVRFISAEPLLGPLPSLNLDRIDWLITGGESGPGHRPIDPDWVRELRDRSQAAGVAFFHKQWGGSNHAAGGRELDGRTWDEFPTARQAGVA